MPLFRTVIFWMHLITGLIVGTVVLLMALTGATLAFEPQIVGFAERHLHDVKPTGVKLEPAALIEKAKQVKPELPVTGITIFSDPEDSTVIYFGRENLYLDPYTGTVLGKESKMHQWMHWVEDIHRRLGAGETGRKITGACTAGFLFLVISGIYIWWPRNWSRATWTTITSFNPNLKGRSRDWNWHNVIGFWCSLSLLITTFTGLVMSYAWANNLLYRMSGNEPPQMQRMAAPKPGAAEQGKPQPAAVIDLAKFFAVSEKQVSGWQSISVRAGREPGGSVTATIVEEGSRKFMRSQLILNAETAEIIKWEPFSKSNLGKKWRTWVKPIHTGEAFGLLHQMIVFLAALGAMVLVWTGFALAWRRFFTSKN